MVTPARSVWPWAAVDVKKAPWVKQNPMRVTEWAAVLRQLNCTSQGSRQSRPRARRSRSRSLEVTVVCVATVKEVVHLVVNEALLILCGDKVSRLITHGRVRETFDLQQDGRRQALRPKQVAGPRSRVPHPIFRLEDEANDPGLLLLACRGETGCLSLRGKALPPIRWFPFPVV